MGRLTCPGAGWFERGAGEDIVVFCLETEDGSLREVDLDLREAARVQAGQAVAVYGGRHWSAPERIAALDRRNAEIAARMEELREQYPELGEEP